MDTITISTMLDHEKEQARQVLLFSYEQYRNSYYSFEAFNEYINLIKVSLDNPLIDKILIAKDDDNEILGTLQIYSNSDDAYGLPDLNIHAPIVRLLGVHPSARGKGIARKLIEESIHYAKQKQSPSLYLHTGEYMKDAIRLYERFGFKRDVNKEFEKNKVTVRCYRYDIE